MELWLCGQHTHVRSNLVKVLTIFMISVMNHHQRKWHKKGLFGSFVSFFVYFCISLQWKCVLLSLYSHLLQQREEAASGMSILEASEWKVWCLFWWYSWNGFPRQPRPLMSPHGSSGNHDAISWKSLWLVENWGVVDAGVRGWSRF